MKKLFLLSTDWHIKSDNVELSLDLFRQQVHIAKENNVNTLICLGDVFDSRKAQPEIVLNAVSEIVSIIKKADVTLHVIPGNHDKTDGSSESSFLTPFEWVRSPFLLVQDWDVRCYERERGGIIVGYLPYFTEDIWNKKCRELIKAMDAEDPNRRSKRYLFSHQAISGALNNDGSAVDSNINGKILSNFDGAYFGHYHNYQQPLPNAWQIGSWKQANFGEDGYKGFYMFSVDEKTGKLSFEMIPSSYPKYVTYNMDAGEMNAARMKEIINQKMSETSKINIRVAIKGDASLMKSDTVLALEEAGIKVKKDIDIERMDLEAKNYQKKEEMLEAFKDFCSLNKYSYEEGVQILEKAFEEEGS